MKCFECGKEIKSRRAWRDHYNLLIPESVEYKDYRFCSKKCIIQNVMAYMRIDD